MPHPNAHLNLVESSRRLFELDPGAEITAGDGWLFGAGRSAHPVISNAAFRVDDGLDPEEFIERARDHFADRGRGFAIWARAGATEDRDLIDAVERAGLQNVYEMPEMVLERWTPEEASSPPGAELRRVSSAEDAARYWRVATESYADIGFPPEIFAYYENHEYLWADGAAAFLANVDERPAGISMTIVSHGVAGIYWVGCAAEARGRGLGRAASASLQASPMGESLYRQMGFETIYDYRLYLCPAPETNR